MKNQHFIDKNGNYFVAIDPVETPEGSFVVEPQPAPHWVWLDGRWSEGVVQGISKEDVRAKRNSLLTLSDWTQLPDAPVDQTAWAAYRQTLRDITDQEGFPLNVEWPVAPN